MMIQFFVLFLLGSSAQVSLASAFDNQIVADRPVLYLPLWARRAEPLSVDLSGFQRHGRYGPQGQVLRQTRLPNGDGATVFNGDSEFIEVASHPSLSVSTTGILTLEAWIRPDALEFPSQEGDGYVHWAGKGEAGKHEYATRMYSRTTSASPPRPSRISGYAFNLAGGLGSGSYFQDQVQRGAWIHVAVVINTLKRSSAYPTGYVRIYKNGILRQTTPLKQFDVVPRPGPAPLRIGTRDFRSFFKGAIGKFAVYNYEVTAAKLLDHYRAMTQ